MAENPMHGELNLDPSKTVKGIASRIIELVLDLWFLLSSNEKVEGSWKGGFIDSLFVSLAVSGEKPKH